MQKGPAIARKIIFKMMLIISRSSGEFLRSGTDREYKIVIRVARKRKVGIRVIKNSTSPRLKGPSSVLNRSIIERGFAEEERAVRPLQPSRAKKYDSILRDRRAPPHLISTILSTGLVPAD